jgi:hypothetical protein
MRRRISRHLDSVLAAAPPPPARPERRVADAEPEGLTRPDLADRLAPADEPQQVQVPPEFNGRDYTIFLLRIAAEIEHSLMAQYLFAAYSLGGPNVPDEQNADVRSWQETILGIAKEEMGHLITVQNLLTVLGAPRQFDRDDYPNVSPLYPFGFRLEPISLNSLAAYVCAESPLNFDGPEADEIKSRAQAQVGDVVNRVGAVFEQLIQLFENPETIPDDAFHPATMAFQARWDEWGRGYRDGARGAGAATPETGLPTPELVIIPVDSRASALAALRAIAEQGEGLDVPEDDEDSHFVRFLAIYRALKALGPGIADVVRPVASNPTTATEGGDPDDLDTPTTITHPEAVLWAHLFNVRYRKLLVNLSHAFELTDDPADLTTLAPRGGLIHRTFAEMYNLRAIAGVLIRLPARVDDEAGPRAGPPFQMPYTLNLPSAEADRWRVHRDLLDAAGSVIGRLRDEIGDGDGQDYLIALAQWDGLERLQVEQLIAASPAAVPAGAPS